MTETFKFSLDFTLAFRVVNFNLEKLIILISGSGMCLLKSLKLHYGDVCIRTDNH
jgi:hypothetical protein